MNNHNWRYWWHHCLAAVWTDTCTRLQLLLDADRPRYRHYCRHCYAYFRQRLWCYSNRQLTDVTLQQSRMSCWQFKAFFTCSHLITAATAGDHEDINYLEQRWHVTWPTSSFRSRTIDCMRLVSTKLTWKTKGVAKCLDVLAAADVTKRLMHLQNSWNNVRFLAVVKIHASYSLITSVRFNRVVSSGLSKNVFEIN